jgi:hypothetical protein
LSKHCGNSKSVTLCNPNFGGEVLGYPQEGLSNIESESHCTVGSDHNTEYTEAEWQNQEVYPTSGFTQTF